MTIIDISEFEFLHAEASTREASTREASAGLLTDLIDGLVASSEPAVVFSSLAETCVPLLGARCTVDLDEDEEIAYRVERPTAPDRRSALKVFTFHASTSVRSSSENAAGGPGYRARVECSSPARHARSTSHHYVLQLVVDAAVQLVRNERTRAALDAEHVLSAQLRDALTSSREIGMAVGILMNAGQLTSKEAFELLSTFSQNNNRKVRDIASDLVLTGSLPN